MKLFKCSHVIFELLVVCVLSQSVDAGQPNVVFLLSDDQSWGDYGFMGHPHIQTPNIDQLARTGLIYERGYVTAPLCRPSLASLVTGMYPHEIDIRGNDPIFPESVNRRKGDGKKLWAKYRDRMTKPIEKFPSFVKSLRDNGYATLQTGKWWEGNPLDHGFTDAMTHGDVMRGGRHGDEGLEVGRTTMQPIYDFVDQADANDQPFMIWYGVFLPHSPHNAADRLYDKYKNVAPNESTARYWANVQWLDDTCGEIVDYLKKKDLYEDTIFIYTCDNGWTPDPEKVNNSIRSKRDPVEAGIRTPIIITHAKTINPKRDTTTLASNIDIAPTILRACGIDPPSSMRGLDLREPQQLQKRDRVFVDVYDHDSDLDKLDDLDSGLKARVVIDGFDKLIVQPDTIQLFDLKNDPDDQKDLAADNPEMVNKLSGYIESWLGDVATK